VGIEPQESVIGKLLVHWFPSVTLPANQGQWNKLCCPFHDETRPSATVNYDDGGFKCHACGEKGDVVSLIRRKEDLGYVEALEYAERISGTSYQTVQSKPKRKPSRRVFGEPWTP
jgi:DNA primase